MFIHISGIKVNLTAKNAFRKENILPYTQNQLNEVGYSLTFLTSYSNLVGQMLQRPFY